MFKEVCGDRGGGEGKGRRSRKNDRGWRVGRGWIWGVNKEGGLRRVDSEVNPMVDKGEPTTICIYEEGGVKHWA